MESSSRIFVKGLPPTFTEADFRKHFSQRHPITDAKIFANRRIGYVGFKTSEDAQKAVKYFNKTFIRMSRIGVELARPVQDQKEAKQTGSAPTARRKSSTEDENEVDRNSLKRKRESEGKEETDPKLKEFLEVMKPKSKRKVWESGGGSEVAGGTQVTDQAVAVEENASDDEYEVVPKKSKHFKSEAASHIPTTSPDETLQTPKVIEGAEDDGADQGDGMVDEKGDRAAISDADWARSRTSRLLGLLDEDEEETAGGRRLADDDTGDFSDEMEPPKGHTGNDSNMKVRETSSPAASIAGAIEEETAAVDEGIRSTMRLFIRNLSYDVTQEDLQAEFSEYGNLEEVHVPLDTKTGSAKGFALVQFTDPDSAEQALLDKDGSSFQGRLIHILPAKAKRENKLDEFALSKLPLKKQQQIKKRREAASSTFNWNALYMNADAVVSSVADRLGLAKSEVLDPTSSDAAVKQAHAETHIIQETKAYFKQQGVDLESFKKSRRGDTAILVKNIPYDCSKDELQRLFGEHGDIKRFVMPPSGVIAIVEYTNAAQCKAAFGALAYRKMKSSVLFLEKAPQDLFNAKPSDTADAVDGRGAVSKTSASDLKDSDLTVPDTAGIATLFVRNLNFSTTSAELTETFKPLDGFLTARVKTKTDPKKPGVVLSMGFGFLEFRSASQAQAALRAMDGYTLAGHKLQIRASHKGADAAEERRKADTAKKEASKSTKIIIKNLPFEATKKDVRSLFGAYGQLRSVRVPKKMDRAARGFAFADFTTPKEAEAAMDALRDTHLLGRRLVLDFAEADAVDAEAEIERMQQKVGAQVNKVALQRLTSGGRKKFTTANEEVDEG